MGEPSLGTPPSERPLEDRLDSWKEIAAYLNRDVTTVQRWEKREGMPVHRHLHDRMGSVYASRAELDAWTRSRNLRPAQENGNNALSPNRPAAPPRSATSTSRTRWRFVLPLAAVAVALAIGASLWLQRTEYFWRNPIADARFQTVTDFDGVGAGRCGVTRRPFRGVSVGPGRTDGRLGYAGRFGTVPQPDPRERRRNSPIHRSAPWGSRPMALSSRFGFASKTARAATTSASGRCQRWADEPRPYLEGVAEFDWSHDGSRLAYHTPGPGDPLFVSDGSRRPEDRPIFTAPAGLHTHFPLWAPDAAFIYFVQGSLPDKLDIWRIRSSRRNSGTDHVAQWARESSGPVGSAHADVPRQRSRWFGTVALQHGRRAPHSPPADLWP